MPRVNPMLRALDEKIAGLRLRREELDHQIFALEHARQDLAAMRPKRKKGARVVQLPVNGPSEPKPDGA